MNYLKNFEDHNLLAFRPTGWVKDSKPQYGSRISIVGEFPSHQLRLSYLINLRFYSGVQYSEHSSYLELKRFVRFVQPEKVISTVPISSSNQKTQSVPKKWLTTTKPMTVSSQRTVTSFMKLRKNVVSAIASKTVTTETQQIQDGEKDDSSFESFETDFMP